MPGKLLDTFCLRFETAKQMHFCSVPCRQKLCTLPAFVSSQPLFPKVLDLRPKPLHAMLVDLEQIRSPLSATKKVCQKLTSLGNVCPLRTS